MYTQEQKKLINEVLDELCRYMDKPSTEAIYKRWFVSRVSDFKEKHNLNEPMFEVGRCYKEENHNLTFLITEIKDFTIYGYGFNGDRFDNDGSGWVEYDDEDCTEIPREEFNKMLLEYAEKKYPKGTKVKSELSTRYIVNNLSMIGNDIFTGNGYALIFNSETGQWAEIEPIILKVPKGTNYRVEEV